MFQQLKITTYCFPSILHSNHQEISGQRRKYYTLSLLSFFAFPSPPLPPLGLCLASNSSLPRPRRVSLGRHGVAAVWVPLHVADAPHGLHLGATGAKLIEMPVIAFLQQVLAAAVARVLITHPTGERKRREERGRKGNLHFQSMGGWQGCRRDHNRDKNKEKDV